MAAIGENQKKILLFLEAGLALALSGSPRTSFRILKAVSREWRRIEREALYDSIRRLYQSRLVDARDYPDGTTSLILTDEGKRRVLRYKLDKMTIPRPKQWDRKWRVILFDIPERRRRLRDVLRGHLRRLGCHEFQKSVFVHPYECRNEIDFLIEFYQVRPFVRFIIAEEIDTALHLQHKFRV